MKSKYKRIARLQNQIISEIGNSYVINGDYVKAYKTLDYIGITEIKVKWVFKLFTPSYIKITITITANRCGLLVGKKGADIDKLKSSLEKSFKEKIVIDLKQTDLFSILYPVDYSSWDDE